MIRDPFAHQILRGRVSPVTVHNQDAFKSLLGQRVENLAHDRQESLDP